MDLIGKGGEAKGVNYYYGSAGGGSGGFNSTYATTEPGTIISITVGAGGNNTSYVNGLAKNGNSGFVLVAYGGDI